MPVELFELLSNHLVLAQTAPYLPISALFILSRTSWRFHELLHSTPEVWKRLDLSTIKGVPLDTKHSMHAEEIRPFISQGYEEETLDHECCCTPLLRLTWTNWKWNLLTHTQTLILDMQFVPADTLRNILIDDAYHIRIISLLRVRGLDIDDFGSLTNHIVNYGLPSRVSRRLEGVYLFGTSTPEPRLQTELRPIGRQLIRVDPAERGEIQNPWYRKSGRLISLDSKLSTMVAASRGVIVWDAVLCRGPRHMLPIQQGYRKPTVASIALGPGGCHICHSSPEGAGSAADELPLLAPPPLHGPSIQLAQRPSLKHAASGEPLRFFARCSSCLKDRYCVTCCKWWCEQCYEVGGSNCYAKHDVKGMASAGIKVSEVSIDQAACLSVSRWNSCPSAGDL